MIIMIIFAIKISETNCDLKIITKRLWRNTGPYLIILLYDAKVFLYLYSVKPLTSLTFLATSWERAGNCCRLRRRWSCTPGSSRWQHWHSRWGRWRWAELKRDSWLVWNYYFFRVLKNHWGPYGLSVNAVVSLKPKLWRHYLSFGTSNYSK